MAQTDTAENPLHYSDIDYEKLSPMMKIYMDTKKEYSDCILMYRLGDFYEMFFDDALAASKALEITLTGKECGLERRAPMCGVPWHAVDSYVDRLVKEGYRVAIAEQLEDPKLAKGLVKRDVIRVVTPGTVISSGALEETRNNYLLSIAYFGNLYGLAFCDVTTGDFQVTEAASKEALEDEIFKFTPAEIIKNEWFDMSGEDLTELQTRIHFSIYSPDQRFYDQEQAEKVLLEHFHAKSLDELGLAEFPVGTAAAGALMQYLYATQKNQMPHITEIHPYENGRYMVLDTFTRRNLELTETLREKNRRGSLLWVLDRTKTAMGARLLRSFIEQPLLNIDEITARQDAVEELVNEFAVREEIREYLGPVYDLERLIARISYKSAGPRELLSFASSLKMLPPIRDQLALCKSSLLQKIREDMDPLDDICGLIDRAISEDPPITVREGGIIREGYSQEVDLLRKTKTDGRQWLLDLEAREQKRTGIAKLKIKFNHVFGYAIEIPNSAKAQVPEDYVRRQTLTTSERYITPELKKLEDQILGADDRLAGLEYDLFCDVRDKVGAEVSRIQKTARAVALLDVLASLAAAAQQNDYVRPKMNTRGVISIRDGRHPVVEKMLKDSMFVANDSELDQSKNRIAIITGPNMAGKSTYMRQVALICLMAQIGSFVPASSADICVSDRIFTRVGASDDLASGQSTFMVEMTEVANILKHATRRSLIILDEIGRGTSTYDGMSLAWAIVEYIADPKVLGAKTLFATHYHELTELEGALPGVKNYCIAVREEGDTVRFLRKIIRGGADRSYGIQVARLAGLPDRVIERADELIVQLTDADIAARAHEIAQSGKKEQPAKVHVKKPDDVESGQLSFASVVSDDEILKEITDMDITRMTPMDAMNTLYQLQAKIKNRVTAPGNKK